MFKKKIKKKILLLGGAAHQLPAITYSNKNGYFTIVCDYLPKSPGHKLASKSYKVSTLDKLQILKIAKEENISGIVSYASDPAALIQSFVAEKLNLIGNSINSVKILSSKILFRKFQKKNNFLHPFFVKLNNFIELKAFIKKKGYGFVLKPEDASGSKGVYKIFNDIQLKKKFNNSKKYSRSGNLIAEKIISNKGFQIAGDAFVKNRKLVFMHLGDEHFNTRLNKLVPIGESFPASISKKIEKRIFLTLTKLFKKLNIKQGAFNLDIMVTNNDEIFIIEIGPRNGGNLIPEVIKYSTGVDLIKATIETYMNGNIKENFFKKKKNEFICSFMIHAKKSGKLKNINFVKNINQNILEKNIYVKKNQNIKKFNKANDAIGSVILKFSNKKNMNYFFDNHQNFIKVEVV